jgi:hypothetical protein
MTEISKGDVVVGIIVGVIALAAVASTYLLFVDRSLAVPLAVLLGAIVGSTIGFLGSVVSVTWLEPVRREEEKKALAKDTRTALYNQMMHLYILIREAPQKLIEDPERLSYDAYIKAHGDTIFFYSVLRESEVFDLTYSKLQEVKKTILQIKADFDAARPKKGIARIVPSLAEITSTVGTKGVRPLQRTTRGVDALAKSEIGSHSQSGPTQLTLRGNGETVSKMQLKQELENAANYIEFLIIHGYFDFDLVKEVCNTTSTEMRTIKHLEGRIHEENKPIEEKMKALVEEQIREQGGTIA